MVQVVDTSRWTNGAGVGRVVCSWEKMCGEALRMVLWKLIKQELYWLFNIFSKLVTEQSQKAEVMMAGFC